MSFTFEYPHGLWGLLLIPVLVLIYILKNKHTEQVISSTYLWTLSERFLKRRNPISRVTGIISLILQILAVLFISIGISQPVFKPANAADDFVFILDASGSMHYEQGDTTRFELGKNKIAELIEESAEGSAYTLIRAGEGTGTLYKECEEKAEALAMLEEAQPSSTTPNFTQARSMAQELFAQKPSSKIYLVTDKGYADMQNVTLINVAENVENYAVYGLEQGLKEGKLVVMGKACSYKSDATLSLSLELINGDDKVTQAQTIEVNALEEKVFSFTLENSGYQSITVKIDNEDSLPLDNESILYGVNSVNTTKEGGILLVSEDGFFLKEAFESLVGESGVETCLPSEYDSTKQGYQLYVFEDFVPQVLPGGAVWFVNPSDSVPDAGFSVLQEKMLPAPQKLEYSTSTATRVEELLKNTHGDEISIDMYIKCSLYRSFHTLISYEGSPVVFAGTNSKNLRQVVFAFDFHRADFILKFDYMVLMKNLLNFTSPAMVTRSGYECGESVLVNVFADCESIRIDTPTGDIAYLDVSQDLAEYMLNEVGTYKITQMRGGNPQVAYIYGNLPAGERAAMVNEEKFIVEGTPSEERRAGRYDDLTILFIVLAAIFIADWMVYCYEQYQLR